MSQSPLDAARNNMSFVTTVCGEPAGRPRSPAPPEPCAPNPPATSDASVTAAHHRAPSLIPTSVDCRSRRRGTVCRAPLLPGSQRESDIHVPAGSRLIIAPRHEAATHPYGLRVDRHGAHVRPVEQVVEAAERMEPHAPEVPLPSQTHVGRPPRTRSDGEGVVHEEARRMCLLDLGPGAAGPGRPRLNRHVEPVPGNGGECAVVEVVDR